MKIVLLFKNLTIFSTFHVINLTFLEDPPPRKKRSSKHSTYMKIVQKILEEISRVKMARVIDLHFDLSVDQNTLVYFQG